MPIRRRCQSRAEHNVVKRHYTFSIMLRPEPEGGSTVRVPALPEIVTYGETEDEAVAMAQEAISLVLEDRAARGEPIPAEDSIQIRAVDVTVAA
jgi:antitoxin HicB